MKGYFDRLESLNMVFNAELSINIILFGLPADYNQFVLSYQMNRKETSIKLMITISLLQTAEQGIKKIDVPSTSAAHVLTVVKSFGYLFYKPKDNVVFVAQRGVFFEREMISKEDSRSKIDIKEIRESIDEESIVNTDTQPEVFSIWKAFGGNTRNLGSFGEETDQTTNQHQESSRFKVSEPGDDVTIFTRRRHTSSSDSVTTSFDGDSPHRLNSDLEDSTL
nr:hypothetical protein [Tanacetum cinerariifolium]